jgi:hypothetical protein
MYRKTQQPKPEPLTRRDKRGIAVVLGALLVIAAGLGIWTAVRPGEYGSSRDGCVTVTEASSTGGGLVHACGSSAVAMCRAAFRHDDKAALLTRPQCRLAGLGPAATPRAPTTPSGR